MKSENAAGFPPRASAGLAMIGDDEGVAAIGHETRRRVLEALAARPDSAAGLAGRLDETRQRMNYHVRALERAGLVELAEERPARGLTERIYRPAGRGFAVDPAVLGSLDAGRALMDGDRWAADFAVALSSRTTREIAELGRRAGDEGKRLAVASMDTTVRLAGPKAMEAFVDELARAVADVVARHDTTERDARPFRLITCVHPAPGGREADAEPEEPDDE